MNQFSVINPLRAWIYFKKVCMLLTIISSFTYSVVFAEAEVLEVYINANEFELKSNTISKKAHWDTLIDTYLTLSQQHPDLEVNVIALDDAKYPATKVVDRLKWLGSKNIKIVENPSKANPPIQRDIHNRDATLEAEMHAKHALEKVKETERKALEERQQQLMELEEEIIDSAVPEFSGSCQEWTQVNTYIINVDGNEIKIPKNLALEFNNHQTFKSEKTTDWLSPYNFIRITTIKDKIILLIVDEDCEDYFDTKMLIISKTGEVLAQEDLWTEHWTDAFYLRNNKITYWSEWFCAPNNKEATTYNSYLYTWPGFGKFEKEVVSREEICTADAQANILQDKLHFELLKPLEQ